MLMAFPLSRPINLLILHHSASPRATKIEQIREWHLKRGFQDIGYHWVIDGSATLLPGRPQHMAGAHAAGHNTHSFGICVTGDNTSESEGWSLRQEGALVEFLFKFRMFFPRAEIIGHRDLPDASTLCPGIDVREFLRRFNIR